MQQLPSSKLRVLVPVGALLALGMFGAVLAASLLLKLGCPQAGGGHQPQPRWLELPPQREPQQEPPPQFSPEKFELAPAGQNDSYVAMCLSVKDEHCDVREWVHYHASLGVARIYLFDTSSEPPMRGVLEDVIASGLVDYYYVTNQTAELVAEFTPDDLPEPGGHGLRWQHGVYRLCLKKFGPRHRWMAFIDADEYIQLQEGAGASLPAFLQQYEQYGGLQLNWQFYASSGHILRPHGGVLRSYTQCCSERQGQHMKSIVQPAHTAAMSTVHHFAYHGGKFAVNTQRKKVRDARHKATFKGAVVNHYLTRSLWDFQAKQRRGTGDGGVKKLTFFLWAQKHCNGTCTRAAGLGEALWRRYNLSWSVPGMRECGRVSLADDGE